MGVDLTHHDINWACSYQNSKETGYYLRIRAPLVSLISCLSGCNKGLDENFLLISGDWHDGLHCPIIEGVPSGVTRGLGLIHPSLFLLCTSFVLVYLCF